MESNQKSNPNFDFICGVLAREHSVVHFLAAQYDTVKKLFVTDVPIVPHQRELSSSWIEQRDEDKDDFTSSSSSSIDERVQRTGHNHEWSWSDALADCVASVSAVSRPLLG